MKYLNSALNSSKSPSNCRPPKHKKKVNKATSKESSRSPSPELLQTSYYKNITPMSQKLGLQNIRTPSLQCLNNMGTHNLLSKKMKLEICGSSKNFTLSPNTLEISMNKSHSSIQNLAALAKSGTPKINYDSFLEYLNETIKHSNSSFFNGKGKTSLKQNTNATMKYEILSPSDRSTYKKSSSLLGATNQTNSGQASSDRMNKVSNKLKTSIYCLPDYGATDLRKAGYNLSKSNLGQDKSQKRLNSSKSRSKNISKSKKSLYDQTSIERNKDYTHNSRDQSRSSKCLILMIYRILKARSVKPTL